MRPNPVSCPLSSVPCSARCRRGATLVLAMVVLLVVSLVAAALVQSHLAAHRQSGRYADELQAQWLAEAGLARAVAKLHADAAYQGETWQAEVADDLQAEVKIVVDSSAPKKIAVEAVYPSDDHRRVLVRREILLTSPHPEP